MSIGVDEEERRYLCIVVDTVEQQRLTLSLQHHEVLRLLNALQTYYGSTEGLPPPRPSAPMTSNKPKRWWWPWKT